jgi:hypothetical protein
LVAGVVRLTSRARILASVLLISLLSIVWALVAQQASATSKPALARTTTQTHIYQAFSGSGRPSVRITSILRGSCWSDSLAAGRDDAWRCMSGNYIFDPCFSSPKAQGVVLCVVSPWNRSGVEIVLTKRLPNPYAGRPSTTGLPWAIQTFTGLKCELATGSTTAVGSRRANYGCNSNEWLWGAPLRSSEPWMIYAAAVDAKHLSKRVKIAVAWF